MSYIEKGGTIMYILVALNTIGFSVMLWKMFQIFQVERNKKGILFELIEKIQKKGVPLHDEHIIVELAKDELSARLHKLEGGLTTVKIIASISPLLGLLGTVIGVLMAFDAISKSGMGDPNSFGGSISLALITTVGGMIVSIPHYVGYNYLIGMIDSIEVDLEKEILPAIVTAKS